VGFTLVELLVVITIIGILVALITVAAGAALKKGRQTAIKVELDQISMAFENYKQDVAGAYPPNLQVDDTVVGASEPTAVPIDESQVQADIRRHLKQVSSNQREPDDLVLALAGLAPSAGSATNLAGGMTAGEAVVFWLSGFSSDPKFPISGEGGPSYAIPSIGDANNYQLDPIENRRWVYEFETGRLEPRDPDGYFDQTDGRFIEYTVTINGQPQTRRINFWQYLPRNSTQPYLYFDTSRHPAAVLDSSGNVFGPYDPPAASQLAGLNPVGSMQLHVHALKKVNPPWTTANASSVPPIVFVNQDKFQLLHCGIDDEWGEDFFEETTAHDVPSTDPGDYLLYPDGPFTGDAADTLVNFSDRTLEDSQP
jgi:prepilin-type N-terminal cleavage/methylation domain-containing protein